MKFIGLFVKLLILFNLNSGGTYKINSLNYFKFQQDNSKKWGIPMEFANSSIFLAWQASFAKSTVLET